MCINCVLLLARITRTLFRSISEPGSSMLLPRVRPSASTSITIPSDEDDCSASQRHVFMEFFSPPRVAVELRRYGLPAQYSFDIQTGYDFTTFEDRARALRLVRTHCPFFTMLSAPCTMYSPLQNLNLGKMDPQVKKKRFDEAHCLLDFSMILAQNRITEGRFFCHEHPQRATSWQRETVRRVMQCPNVQTVTFDQCRVGLKTPDSKQPLRKRTTLLTNSPAIVSSFSPLQCNCQAEHGVIQGSEAGVQLSKYCQVYTPELVELLAKAVRQQFLGTP